MGKKRLLPPTLLSYYPTPVQEIADHPVCTKAGVRIVVKREDLNHPLVSGNKWWKLKYNLEAASQQPHQTVLTFGGAFSNHIYATAAASKTMGLKAVGLVRGEKTLPLNPVLRFAIDHGMTISYVDRAAYRKKSEPEFIEALHKEFGDFFLIPEGGSNDLAVKGCAEFAEEQLSKITFEHLFLPVGTGGTMAGIVCGFRGTKNINGVSVLKDGKFIEEHVGKFIRDFSGSSIGNWSLLTGYHEGGYAKTTPRLLNMISEMQQKYDLPLDHVYTGKLLWAVMNEVEAGSFSRGSTILVLHTGGLQGASASNTTP